MKLEQLQQTEAALWKALQEVVDRHRGEASELTARHRETERGPREQWLAASVAVRDATMREAIRAEILAENEGAKQ